MVVCTGRSCTTKDQEKNLSLVALVAAPNELSSLGEKTDGTVPMTPTQVPATTTDKIVRLEMQTLRIAQYLLLGWERITYNKSNQIHVLRERT